jgi:hypothetical protein
MTEDKDEENIKIERRGKDDWKKGIGCINDGRQRRRGKMKGRGLTVPLS